MPTYTDEDIRGVKKITCKIAGDYLGVAPMAISIAMRNDLLPIGFCIHTKEGYHESWSYHIIAERLIAYKHGRITEIQVQGIEKGLSAIVSQLEEVKHDLLFLLSENGGSEDINSSNK